MPLLLQLFPLTENTINKTEVFTIIYRIINSAKNYVNNVETRKKLQQLLDSCKEEYEALYKSLLNYQSFSFNSYVFLRKIGDIYKNYEKNMKINNLIDSFLVFAEKQTFYDLDKITGVETDKKEGEDVVNKLIGVK